MTSPDEGGAQGGAVWDLRSGGEHRLGVGELTGTPRRSRWPRCAAGGAAEGRAAYPAADRLLITADAGGSNGYRLRAWKARLAALAAETGLEVTVVPPAAGDNQVEQIEHRLFSAITHELARQPVDQP